MNRTKSHIVLGAILLVNFALTSIGIGWGLPNRWCVDEQVANSLKLIASKSIFTVITNVHPQLYNLFLGALFLPYLLIKKITHYPLTEVAGLASVSWIDMAHKFGDFASSIYLVARFSSVLLGCFTIYILYRAAAIIHGKKPALFSAFILAVSMGFVETNHLAKHTSLVVFLVLLVLFLCLKALTQRQHFRRYFYSASFFCGLAATAKLDGIISSLFILGTIFYLLFQDNSGKSIRERLKNIDCKLIIFSGSLFAAGVILGWPALLVSFNRYYETRHTHNGIFYGGFHPLTFNYIWAILEKIKDTCILLIRNFSLPLSFFIFYGIARFFKNIRRYPFSWLIATMLVPYIFISLVYFTEYPGTSTKLIVHASIIFCIFAGKVMSDFLSKAGKSFIGRGVLVTAVLGFAVFYTFQSSLFFYNRDTRYLATTWILDNIPTDMTIEHYQEGENLFSASIIPFKYDVIFWGRHSKMYTGKKSLYFRNVSEKLAYRENLNNHGSEADFFMLALGGEFVMKEPVPNTFLYRLYHGQEKSFRLARVFKPRDNFFLRPRPEWTAPEIFIYERVNQVE